MLNSLSYRSWLSIFGHQKMGGSVSAGAKNKNTKNTGSVKSTTPVTAGQTKAKAKMDDSCELGNKRSRAIHCYVKLGMMRQFFVQLEAEWKLLAECKNGEITQLFDSPDISNSSNISSSSNASNTSDSPVGENYTLGMSIVLSPPSALGIPGIPGSLQPMPSTLILHAAPNFRANNPDNLDKDDKSNKLDKLDRLDKSSIIPQVLYGYPVSRNFHVIAERRGLVDRSSVLQFTTRGNPNIELDAVLASLDDSSGKLIHILGNPTSNSFIPDDYVIGITKQQARALGVFN